LNDIGRNSLLGNRKKIAKFLMRTFTCRSTFLYAAIRPNNPFRQFLHAVCSKDSFQQAMHFSNPFQQLVPAILSSNPVQQSLPPAVPSSDLP
jgi:hypothetical protein